MRTSEGGYRATKVASIIITGENEPITLVVFGDNLKSASVTAYETIAKMLDHVPFDMRLASAKLRKSYGARISWQFEFKASFESAEY